MTRRKRYDEFDDDVRVTDRQGPIRGRIEWERAGLREARRMRATGETVGHVDPPPADAALDQAPTWSRTSARSWPRSTPAA